jgi:hypothetical protein
MSLTSRAVDAGPSPESDSVLAAVEALGDRASVTEAGVRAQPKTTHALRAVSLLYFSSCHLFSHSARLN